jgi:hypothetical protein
MHYTITSTQLSTGRVGGIKTEENTILVCPNKACGKTFAKPLKTTKIHEGTKEHYNACPYCLTDVINSEIEKENPPEVTVPEVTVTEVPISEENPGQDGEKTSSCTHYRGYLSEKDHKQQIPEDCMVCSQLIECMHKK